MDVYRQKYNGKTWGCFRVSDVENPTVLFKKKKKKNNYKPPYSRKERGSEREKSERGR